ncbi:glycosyltransferase family 4 protein [Deinococcus humi]|uniref:Glycosyltransferase involved in cell wall biosynthesis n=1 Tax=Deinococcus humi TaxID=662880 RepID=A0A7W8JPY0_9DEIO|nr:glycosyltransferase family 4 protein [Deinococcus humi]MBB5361077.1 glycosyltransferase involved in cell wall biosynthesis [Deinococcus humi]GGO18338.1 LPS biosynthesis protein [Deinococcus humi]
MLRAAFLTDAPRVAGSEIWLLEVLPRLADHGIEPSVFLPRAAPLDELAARLTAAGVAVHRITHPSELPPQTADFDVRVLQVWNPRTYTRLLPDLAAPRVVIVHDQLDYHYPLGLRPLYREIYRHTKARPQRSAERVVTVSQWGRAFLERLGGAGVVGLRNGVDPHRFRPAEAGERQRLRAGLGFDRFTVLVPGRFAPEKNQLAAVRAARHSRNLNYVFAGDMDSGTGALARRLARALRLDNVHFLGRRWDMPELYRAADALLQPTLAENQSLVTLEAMGSALPVVTTPIPAQAELVGGGQGGLLVPPVPALLAQALNALAAHPDRARALGEAGRRHVLAHHTLAHTAAQTAEMLREATRTAAPR